MNRRTVRNAADWTARRAEIRQLLEKWQVGRMPTKATIFRTTVQSETAGNGYLTRVVEIVYGPQADKTTTVTVTLDSPGRGPFPVMIGGAAASLLRRGYITCAYSGTVDAPGTSSTRPASRSPATRAPARWRSSRRRSGRVRAVLQAPPALVLDGKDGRRHHTGGGRAVGRCRDRSRAYFRVRLHGRGHRRPVRRRARFADQERRVDQRVHADAHRHRGPRDRRPRPLQ
jgi:hypothetical protein